MMVNRFQRMILLAIERVVATQAVQVAAPGMTLEKVMGQVPENGCGRIILVLELITEGRVCPSPWLVVA